MLIFSLAHKNMVNMYVNPDGRVEFHCSVRGRDQFLGMLPVEKDTELQESDDTLMYRQLSDIIYYRLNEDLRMFRQASKAAAEINAPIARAKIQVVPSLMATRLEPSQVLYHQKAGGRLVILSMPKIRVNAYRPTG